MLHSATSSQNHHRLSLRCCCTLFDWLTKFLPYSQIWDIYMTNIWISFMFSVYYISFFARNLSNPTEAQSLQLKYQITISVWKMSAFGRLENCPEFFIKSTVQIKYTLSLHIIKSCINMHEPVMSVSISWSLFGVDLLLFRRLWNTVSRQVFSKIEQLWLKIQACGREKHAPLFNTNLIALPGSSTIILPVGGMTDRWA